MGALVLWVFHPVPVHKHTHGHRVHKYRRRGEGEGGARRVLWGRMHCNVQPEYIFPTGPFPHLTLAVWSFKVASFRVDSFGGLNSQAATASEDQRASAARMKKNKQLLHQIRGKRHNHLAVDSSYHKARNWLPFSKHKIFLEYDTHIMLCYVYVCRAEYCRI